MLPIWCRRAHGGQAYRVPGGRERGLCTSRTWRGVRSCGLRRPLRRPRPEPTSTASGRIGDPESATGFLVALSVSQIPAACPPKQSRGRGSVGGSESNGERAHVGMRRRCGPD